MVSQQGCKNTKSPWGLREDSSTPGAAWRDSSQMMAMLNHEFCSCGKHVPQLYSPLHHWSTCRSKVHEEPPAKCSSSDRPNQVQLSHYKDV